MMNVEQSVWNENWQGEPKYKKKTCVSAILYITNPTQSDLDSNPCRRGGKPKTNGLSYGTAPVHLRGISLYKQIFSK
jgi:hypothetical protein